MKTVENLKHGEVLLVSLRPIASGKIQLEVAEHVTNPNLGVSLVSLLNASDERFQQGKPRRAWISAEPADVIAYFPQLAEKVKEVVEAGKKAIANGKLAKDVDPIVVNMLNPNINGLPLHVNVLESTPSMLEEEYQTASDSRKNAIEWLAENAESRAKRAGMNGEFLFHNGENIISETFVVVGQVQNRFLEITGRSVHADGRDLGHKLSLIEKHEEQVDDQPVTDFTL